MLPTRRQKRWAGRLRTAGALLALLGGVATADHVVGLARAGSDDLAATHAIPAPLPVGLGALALGGLLYLLGRRWSAH
ncbi:MAG: hypothetical protein IT370_02595 [Deltaproteobacteria bacterium]|nr:hypothetical protein [Deltaproteobacteria bacterium]